jgi:methylthioribulose-1-phosphate dehydratase
MRTYRKIIKDSSYFPLSLYETAELNHICNAAKRLDKRNAIPATSSNFSIRTKKNELLITKSGLHKRNLNPSQFIRLNIEGTPLHPQSPKPSDETQLHAMIYRNSYHCNAVIHCHAPELEFVTLEKSELLDNSINEKNYPLCGFFKLKGHEILKALGIKNHLDDYYLPIIQNDQDMDKISKLIEEHYFNHQQKLPLCSFLLENHGIYCFGNSVLQAEVRLEAILHHLSYLKH